MAKQSRTARARIATPSPAAKRYTLGLVDGPVQRLQRHVGDGEVRVLDADLVSADTPEAAAIRAGRRKLIERLSGSRPWG